MNCGVGASLAALPRRRYRGPQTRAPARTDPAKRAASHTGKASVSGLHPYRYTQLIGERPQGHELCSDKICGLCAITEVTRGRMKTGSSALHRLSLPKMSELPCNTYAFDQQAQRLHPSPEC